MKKSKLESLTNSPITEMIKNTFVTIYFMGANLINNTYCRLTKRTNEMRDRFYKV